MKTQYWQNAVGTEKSTDTFAEIRSLAIRAAYAPAAVIGIGPLLPIIGLVYFSKWIADRNDEVEDNASRHQPERQAHPVLAEQLDNPPDL